VVTGDDALHLASSVAAGTAASADALGVNARVSGYAGVQAPVAATLGSTLAAVVEASKATVIGLPVSRYEADSDLSSLLRLWPGPLPAGSVVQDLTTPPALAQAVAGCRAVVTGSYHAAVFALAAGVPVVALSNSGYYDAKFSGLAALFPAATQVVALGGADLAQRLGKAIERAWDAGEDLRQATRAQAGVQAGDSKVLYERFAGLVNADIGWRNAAALDGEAA
jgi:colanic acid/amylovoran biosynthesis protein